MATAETEDYDEDEDWDEDEDYDSEDDIAAESAFAELEGKTKPSTCCGCPEAMCYAIYLFVFTVCECPADTPLPDDQGRRTP
jgi:hypothetical protein